MHKDMFNQKKETSENTIAKSPKMIFNYHTPN